MHILINEIDYCKLQIQYEADVDAVIAKRNEIVNRFKVYRVPGFRVGKATPEAIKMHFKKQIEETLKRELADDAFHNVLFEKNLKPFRQPEVVSSNLENAKFTCEFLLDKQPDFELAEYKAFEIPKFSAQISPEELSQRMVQDLRTRYGNTIPYQAEDFVQMNDTIIIDYSSFFEDGTPVEKLTANGEIVNVGRINIPGFSENLLGMKIGDSREFVLPISEDYSEQELAGNLIKLNVKLVMGSKIEAAPLDDELAKKIGVDTFDNLMVNIRSTADSRVKELETTHNMDQIARRLITNHNFRIPQWVSAAEAQAVVKNANKDWDAMPDIEKEKTIEQTADGVKLSLILGKIRDKEPDAQLTDEEVFEVAKKNLTKHTQEPDKVLSEIFKNGHLPLLFNRIRDEHTLNFIEKTCTFIE